MAKSVPAKPAQANQSIERAISCLLELTSVGRPITCKEMAELLGVERTKVSRMLGTLAYLGMAERLPDLSYVPGTGIHVLAAMSLRGSGMLRVVLPHIERMKKEWNLSGALGVLWRDQVCYLYHGGPDRDVADAIAGHEVWPAVRSAIGKAILADRLDDEIARDFKSTTSAKDYKQFVDDLNSIREHGYFLEGTHSLSMVIGNPAVAGLAFQGHWEEHQTDQLIAETQDIVQQINTELGKRA